jgi:NTE family protein
MDTPLIFDIEEAQYKKLIDRRIDRKLLMKLAARMGEIIENKGIDTGKMRQIVESIVDEEKLRKSDTDFGLVTVSITDLKPLEIYKEDIPEGKMIDYLMASASFPGFKLNSIGDKYFIDGAFYDNCPVNLLARKGYKEIIAIRTLGPGIVQHVRYHNIKLMNIIPSEDLGMPLDFNQELIRRNLQMGYYDTMKSLKGLKGRKYYIIPKNDDEVFDIFYKLSDTLLRELGILFKIKKMPVKRTLFEGIIPELMSLLDLKASSDYQDILLGLLEVLAEDNGVNKYKIYSLEEFIGIIKSNSEGKNKALIKSSNLKKDSSLNKKLVDVLKRKNELRKAAKMIFAEVSNLEFG